METISAEPLLVSLETGPSVDWGTGAVASYDEAKSHSSWLIPVTAVNFVEMNEGIASKWVLKVAYRSQAMFFLCDLSSSESGTTSISREPEWLARLYDASKSGVLDDDIIGMFDALEGAVYSDFSGLNDALALADAERLAPEFAVGIPRALFPVRMQMSNWDTFLMKALASLARRGHDVHELFQGLL